MRILKGSTAKIFPSQKNRTIDKNHVIHLKQSMKKFGFLASKPIQVNDDMSIIDGHHRHRAAHELGIKVYYIIEPVVNVHEMIATIDKGTHKWKILDWVHYWANANKSDYRVALEYIDMGLSPWLILGLASNTSKFRDKVINGEFTIMNPNFYRVISAIREIAEVFPFAKQRAESGAIISIHKNIPTFDLNALAHKCKTFPNLWKRSTNVIDAIKEIEKIYNYRSRDKISFSELYL